MRRVEGRGLFRTLLLGGLAASAWLAPSALGATGSSDSPLFRVKTAIDSVAESPVFALDTTIPLDVADTPPGFHLEPGSPNPSGGQAAIRFALSVPGDVDLHVLDPRGRVIRVLAGAQLLAAGRHHVTWDGRDGFGRPAPAGVYFIRLRCGPRSATQRLSLIR